ncbi:MAG TPA: HAD-IIB family hydrolase [Bryobacteraceae bacterium]|nr:HAD-IIB family hydrolase [Bryobacteraceae bacterium]
MKILVTDLDGTLLNARTYSFEAAQPALAALRKKGVPLVLCTSKTRAEAELWRERLDINHPFIVENGGAVCIPSGYFPFPIDHSVRRDGYDIVEFGLPYSELVRTLRQASRESGCKVVGFHDMSVAEISLRTSLPIRQAEMAKRREYDEPFEIDGPGIIGLLKAIERGGKRWTRGNRFYHITGANDKSTAVRYLRRLYARVFEPVHLIGVGDGHNDAGFLNSVDTPVIVRSPFSVALKLAAPRGRVTRASGPDGWNEAILPLFTRSRFDRGCEVFAHRSSPLAGSWIAG